MWDGTEEDHRTLNGCSTDIEHDSLHWDGRFEMHDHSGHGVVRAYIGNNLRTERKSFGLCQNCHSASRNVFQTEAAFCVVERNKVRTKIL